MPIERQRKSIPATMATRGFLRESGGHDARSERPARWHGQTRRPRFDPRKSLMSRMGHQQKAIGENRLMGLAINKMPMHQSLWQVHDQGPATLRVERMVANAIKNASPTATGSNAGSGTATVPNVSCLRFTENARTSPRP